MQVHVVSVGSLLQSGSSPPQVHTHLGSGAQGSRTISEHVHVMPSKISVVYFALRTNLGFGDCCCVCPCNVGFGEQAARNVERRFCRALAWNAEIRKELAAPLLRMPSPQRRSAVPLSQSTRCSLTYVQVSYWELWHAPHCSTACLRTGAFLAQLQPTFLVLQDSLSLVFSWMTGIESAQLVCSELFRSLDRAPERSPRA